MKEMFETVMKNFLKVFEKKEIVVSEDVVPKSDENEFRENQNNQGDTVQLPCGE